LIVNFSFRHPNVARRPHTRDLHGQRVDDPWYWMRDHDDPDLLAYLDAERAYYDAATEPQRGLRDDIAASLRRREPAEVSGCPWNEGGFTYQVGYPSGAEYPRTVRWPQGDPEAVGTVLDLGDLGDAAYAELGLSIASDDGRLLAYSVDLTGDEVYELRFRHVDTGKDLAERVGRTYYGGAFTADGSAFYYTVHDEAYRPFQVWRHRLGTPVGTDELVLQEDDRHFELDLRRTRSGDWVLVSATSRTTRQEWAIDAHDPTASPLPVRPRMAGVEDTVEHQRTDRGGRWLVVTNEGSTEFRLLAADVATWREERPTWRDLVPGRDGRRLDSCNAFAGHLVLGWRVDARPVYETWRGLGDRLEGPRVLQAAPYATLRLGPNHDYDAEGVVVEETSLVDPSVWSMVPFEGPPAEPEWRVVHRAEAPGLERSRYVTERISVPARDGTPVPVTIAYAAGTPLDGTAPGLIWAYGAYESCDWPVFETMLPEWLDRGFVYALAHVRGGGEGGRTWWDQGHLAAKVTTFTDLIDVADGLVERGLIAADKVATRGLSAGGLLQGAVMTMRPDRWRVVVAEVPFVDCINSMLDDAVPLTVAEWEEWGDPHEPAAYQWMRDYTPYENLPEPPWPTLLVTGALHDPRVLVHEPAKWVAKLRSVQADDAVVLFRAETGPGAHVGPAGRLAHLDYEAEIMAFVIDVLG
jgi:oligopeptidase B